MNRKPGDWDCASCDHLNFSWRDSCQRCSESKPREGHGGKLDDKRGYGRGGGNASHGGYDLGYEGGRGNASEYLYGRNNGDYRRSYGGDYRVGYGGDPRSGYGADMRGGYGGDLHSNYGSDPRSSYGGGGYDLDYRNGYGVDYRGGHTGDYRNGYGRDYRSTHVGGDYMSRSYDEYGGRSFGAGDYNSRSYGGSGGGYGAAPDTRPGDWNCKESSCGAHNFASRVSCFKCGVAKDDRGSKGKGDSGRSGGYESGGKGGARGKFGSAQDSGNAGEGERTEWRSGDWMCTRSGCNEHNFAMRLQCFRCQAPRET